MSGLVVPIFPLPEVALFPATLVPLHVFEARYRALVTDALESRRRLALVQLEPGYERAYEGKPPVRPIAGAGEIVGSERLASGQYDIVVKGTSRIRLRTEIPSDTLYRLVLAEPLEDTPPRTDVSRLLGHIRATCRRLLQVLDRSPDLLDATLADDQPPGTIADRVTAAVLPGSALRQELLETLDVELRLERVRSALDELVTQLRGRRRS